MQPAHGNTKLLQRPYTDLNRIYPGQGYGTGLISGRVRKAQNGMLITSENFTLRMRHGHQPAASSGQCLGMREPAWAGAGSR